MKYLLITSLFLISCTKRLPETVNNDSFQLSVYQAKTTITINIKVDPKDHLRTCDVRTVISGKEIGNAFLIFPNETEVTKTFNTNGVLESYFLSTLADYHQ